MLRDVSTLLNTITWECCSIIENVSVMYVNLVPWRRERRRNVRVTDVVGSRSRVQSHSSVNKTSQWQLACMFRHLHPAPQRGYKRRARANAHQFFAEEPRLCAPAYSGGTATVAMGYVSIPSFRERGLVHSRDVPCQSVMFVRRKVRVTEDPYENATIADPLQCPAEAGKSPHTTRDGRRTGLRQRCIHCCYAQRVTLGKRT